MTSYYTLILLYFSFHSTCLNNKNYNTSAVTVRTSASDLARSGPPGPPPHRHPAPTHTQHSRSQTQKEASLSRSLAALQTSYSRVTCTRRSRTALHSNQYIDVQQDYVYDGRAQDTLCVQQECFLKLIHNN